MSPASPSSSIPDGVAASAAPATRWITSWGPAAVRPRPGGTHNAAEKKNKSENDKENKKNNKELKKNKENKKNMEHAEHTEHTEHPKMLS